MFKKFLCSLGLSVCFAGQAGAAELNHNLSEVVSLKMGDFPLNITVRLNDETQTRMGTKVFVDLTSFQEQLPEILSGPLYDDCEFGVSVDLNEVRPTESAVVLDGLVSLRLNACREENDVTYRRTVLSADVDVTATAFAEVVDNCLVSGIDDLNLDAKGLIGGLANLLGIVEEAEKLILEEAGRITKENPICPDLPEAIDILEPRLSSGGLREFPNGALGAILSGSIEVSATTLLNFMEVLEEEGIFDDLGKDDCACPDGG